MSYSWLFNKKRMRGEVQDCEGEGEELGVKVKPVDQWYGDDEGQ
jgi:hypothetical protein